MKILTIANEKGGVGKTMLATQFALYCALKFRLRVALLDLDQQANSTKFFGRSKAGFAAQAPCSAADLYQGKIDPLREVLDQPFMYVPAKCEPKDKRLEELLENGNDYGRYAENLINAMALLDGHFDLAIIDTNPNPDIRSNSGLIVCTHLLSPIQFAQESIEGLENLFDRISKYSEINSNLESGFLGMLPNMVESTAVQLKNGKEIIENCGHLLISVNEIKPQFFKTAEGAIQARKDALGNLMCSEAHSYAAIKRHAGFQTANENACPIWEVPAQAAAWAELKRAFFTILEKMDIERPNEATTEMNDVLIKCKRLYGASWRQIVRQFWLMDNSAILLGLTPENTNLLRQMRCYVPLSFLKEI